MKRNEIIKCLKANKQLTDYKLIITQKDSRELFYVLKHLEINRAVKTQNIIVHVYVSDKKTTGFSTIKVTAADDSKSLNKKIAAAVKKAKAAKNQYYPLVTKTTNILDKKPATRDLNEIANKCAEAVFKADIYKGGWINSTEIFVSEFKYELVNSKGVNHVSYGFKLEIECIPTWSNGKEEFELYKFYESGKVDYKEITAETQDILQRAKARSQAKKLSEVKIDSNVKVLVKEDMLQLLVDNIADNLGYGSVYQKNNHYVTKDVVSNNKFELTLKGNVVGCANSRKFDDDGVNLKSKTIVKDGVATNYHGGIRFGYYLGEKNISGNLPVAVLKAKPYNYKKEKHLIIENFSSPQLDPSIGYWGGEVRLARYFDGKKYIPLTGFSISGNIYEDLKNVEFSKEEVSAPSYKGPKYFIFKNIQLS